MCLRAFGVVNLGDRLTSVLGGRTVKALNDAFGMTTVTDLLYHFPRRYAERGELTDLAGLRLDEHVTVMAQVDRVSVIPFKGAKRGNRLEVVVTDGTARLTLTFFNQQWRAKELLPGRRGLFAGKVGDFRGKRQLTHPDYQMLPDESIGDEAALAYAGRLVPVYPASTKVSTWSIGQAVEMVLASLDPVPDPVPEEIRRRHALVPLGEALTAIHRPATLAEADRAKRRLTYDEAFLLQAILARRRRHTSEMQAQPRPARADGLREAFEARLPFDLTDGQREVGESIAADLSRGHPMHRLLQGDVGSGKTVVALRAMLQVVDSGGQAVLMAPTEVLAQQHHRSLSEMLGPLAHGGMLGGAEPATRVALLTGSMSASARRASLLDIASGAAGIVVGTHALLQEGVQYADLGLIVVDEQHRFGVEQRSALLDRVSGKRPHLLVMTATPIPRTVAMTLFGDLDTSLLREIPSGRQEVSTHVVGEVDQPHHLDRAWSRAAEEVAKGRKVFVVCPRIDSSGQSGDSDGVLDGVLDGEPAPDGTEGNRPPATVVEVAEKLLTGPLTGTRAGILHGRMSGEEKDRAMRRFAARSSTGDALDVLVSTTVVEVGVDIPTATMMVIMDADRFGVSQLHQLRGRIGRGSDPGLCLLVTPAPRGSPGRERLSAVSATTDGFELARLDLLARREGDVLGTAQSGRRSSLRLLSVLRDEELIFNARSDVDEIFARSPDLSLFPELLTRIVADQEDQRSEYLDKA